MNPCRQSLISDHHVNWEEQSRAPRGNLSCGSDGFLSCGSDGFWRRSKRICIVSNAPISQNPRVVKEADALSAAGYDVFVVFAQHAEWTVSLDQDILNRAKWRARAIEIWPDGTRRQAFRVMLATRRVMFRTLAKVRKFAPIPELAYSRFLLEQLRLAIGARADLYIGHNPQSLPVVVWAARLTNAKYGFDFEDFHLGEAKPSESGALSHQLLALIEGRYLSKAHLITAASWGIAREVAKVHGLAEPLTVLNVFNWADRAKIAAPGLLARSDGLSLYWFSQIVGLDRGLEDVIRALEHVRAPVALHLRGAVTQEVKSNLIAIAQRCGVEGQIRFLDPISPDNLLAAAAEHDVGLCLEVPSTASKDNCIANKIFIYMLAGLAVVASRTRGHTELLKMSPNAGFLYDSDDPRGLAALIERLARDRNLLQRTKAQALEAARDRWNWELESQTLVTAVDRVIGEGYE